MLRYRRQQWYRKLHQLQRLYLKLLYQMYHVPVPLRKRPTFSVVLQMRRLHSFEAWLVKGTN
jgi:hypothetical protein